MKILNKKKWAPFFILSLLLLPISIAHADESSFGYLIFKTQKKMALRGSTLAQYKLGTFYEFGISVPPSDAEAISWYKKAAKKKNKSAINRLIYLDIKKNGYIPSKHSNWLKDITENINSGNANTYILVGQLYQHGLGVRRNLTKAVKLLEKASALGHAEIDPEIDAIHKKLSKHKNKSIAAVRVKKTPKKKTVSAKKSKKSVNKKPVTKKIKTVSKEEKRRRYESALRKQYREALILQQQQEWSEAQEWSDVTDDAEE